jgi:serine/threonine protein kinase
VSLPAPPKGGAGDTGEAERESRDKSEAAFLSTEAPGFLATEPRVLSTEPSILSTEPSILSSEEPGSLATGSSMGVSDDSFLRDVARLSVAEAPPGRSEKGQCIADRYQLVSLLGRGSFGSVWEAHDRISGEEVAVKLLARGRLPLSPRLRREVLALRVLSVPGVVRLRDEGIDGEHAFLVMDRARGAPFPGVPVPCSWSALAPPLVSLLVTLERAHALGVLHRDLKPENVLVDERGRALVLDFGLALAKAQALSRITGRTQIMGTPAFISPEQLAGQPASVRSDLYAVGVMARWALTGTYLHVSDSLPELLRARMTEPAPPLAPLCPGLPFEVAIALDSLVATDPAARPASAAAVLELIRHHAPDTDIGDRRRSRNLKSLLGEAMEKPRSRSALLALFDGHDRIFHAREDAADVLYQRTAGDPLRIEEELLRWRDSGLAHTERGRYRVRRDALVRLSVEVPLLARAAPGAAELASDDVRARHLSQAAALSPGAPGRLAHLFAGNAELDAEAALSVAEEIFTQAEQHRLAGKLEEAATWFAEALQVAREAARTDDPASPSPRDDTGVRAALLALREKTLSRWTAAALAAWTPGALDFVLHELSIETPWTEHFDRLSTLLQAALSVRAETPRAAGLLAAIPPFSDPVLERCRFDLRARAARHVSLDREEAVLAEMARWAAVTGGEARAALAGRTGQLRYAQGRFAEAAALHAQAAALHTGEADRAQAMLSAASAALEAFRWEEACSFATDARAIAASLRHAPFEARAEWLLRCVAYRSGRADAEEPDLPLCAAAADLHHIHLDALIHLTEAAVAWRRGDNALAASLVGRSYSLWTEAGFSLGRLTAGGLLTAAGSPPRDAAARIQEARLCRMPGVGLQSLALFAAHLPEARTPTDEAMALAEMVPRDSWHRRMEVLSVAESLERLGVSVA